MHGAGVQNRQAVESIKDRKVKLFFVHTLGAAGAVGTTNYNDRVSGIVHDGNGVYTLTLMDTWADLLGITVTMMNNAATAAGKGSVWKGLSHTVKTTKTVVISAEIPATGGAAATRAVPPDSAVLYIEITVSRGKI